MIKFLEDIDYTVKDIREYSPVTLAYIGDSVYELFIRSHLLSLENLNSYKLHKLAVKYVSAKNQASILNKLIDHLDEDEKNIIRRARNQKTVSLPKNAGPDEYKLATSFEALIGYLYIKKDYERLNEILNIAVRKEGQ